MCAHAKLTQSLLTGRIRARISDSTLQFDEHILDLGVRSANFIVEHDSRGSLHPRKHVFEIMENGILINETWPPLIDALNGSQVQRQKRAPASNHLVFNMSPFKACLGALTNLLTQDHQYALNTPNAIRFWAQTLMKCRSLLSLTARLHV